jgi:hypothetical protein
MPINPSPDFKVITPDVWRKLNSRDKPTESSVLIAASNQRDILSMETVKRLKNANDLWTQNCE